MLPFNSCHLPEAPAAACQPCIPSLCNSILHHECAPVLLPLLLPAPSSSCPDPQFGFYSLLAASSGCRVVAWEPVPYFAAYFKWGLLRNNLTHAVQVWLIACTASTCSVAAGVCLQS